MNEALEPTLESCATEHDARKYSVTPALTAG